MAWTGSERTHGKALPERWPWRSCQPTSIVWVRCCWPGIASGSDAAPEPCCARQPDPSASAPQQKTQPPDPHGQDTLVPQLDGKPLRTPITHSHALQPPQNHTTLPKIEHPETDERSCNTSYRLEIRGFLPDTKYVLMKYESSILSYLQTIHPGTCTKFFLRRRPPDGTDAGGVPGTQQFPV